MCHAEHVKVRGLFSGVVVILPRHGSWRSNLIHPAWQQGPGHFGLSAILPGSTSQSSCRAVPTPAFLSRLSNPSEAAKYFATPERVGLGCGEGSPRTNGQ